MKQRLSKALTALLVLASLALLAKAAAAEEVSRMAKEELRAMLGNPDVVIIDVRTGRDWKANQLKIKGAVREEPRKQNCGRTNTIKTKPMFYTVLDAMRQPVPVRHCSLWS